MRTRLHTAIILLFAAVLICSAGCQEAQTPSEKQSRLIAARNMELEKQLAAKDKEIENLQAQCAARVGLEQKKLAKCSEESAACQEELQHNWKKKLDEMLIPTLNEAAKVRRENEQLQERIKELEKKLNPSETPAKQE